MRIRSIVPKFWRSKDIVALSIEDRLLFIGLWSYVDDNGVGRDEVSDIIGDLFIDDMLASPAETVARITRGLASLAARDLIARYTSEERPFLYITQWKRYQRIDRPTKARYPLPDDNSCSPREDVSSPRVNVPPGEGEKGRRGEGFKDLAQTGVAALSDRSTPTYPAAFETFWAVYPIKRGKGKALKAWQRAIKRSSPDAINVGAQRYKDDPNRDDGYTKYAEGWLNSDGWLDEALPIRGNDKQTRVNSIVASAIERGNRGENIYAGLMEGNNS